jgi:heptosyltransferase-2
MNPPPVIAPSGRKPRFFIKGLNWVGDAVMATPAIAHVRQSFRNAHITLMVRPWVAAVYENNPDIDRLWVIDDSASMAAFFKAIRMVRRERFDVGIALPNSQRAALLLRLAGIRQRYGFRLNFARGLMLNRAIALDPKLLASHQAYYYLGMLWPLCGQPPKIARQVLHPGDLEREEVAAHLRQLGLDRGQPLVGIAPGSINSSAKRWPAERFAALADRIDAEMGASVLLLGSAKERDVLDRVETLCHARVHNLGGSLNLAQGIALIDRLDGMATNDAGGMHIAAALNVPTVAIFGPTEWDSTYPLSPVARVVRKEGIPCAPCMLRECPIEGHPCMTGVDVETVYRQLEVLMAEGRPDPHESTAGLPRDPIDLTEPARDE